MAAKTSSLEEQVEALRRQLTEAGVKVLSGSWGGKGGIARYKGQWLLVIDRHLPTGWKLRLLQMAWKLVMERAQRGETDGGATEPHPT